MMIASCNSPRPATRNESGASVGSMRIATLASDSRARRSRRCREVTNLPSRPESGEEFTEKTTAIVGSSTLIGGSGSGFSASETVSPMFTSAKPESATMSPGPASAIGVRRSPACPKRPVIFAVTVSPSSLQSAACWSLRMRPLKIRPTISRPM